MNDLQRAIGLFIIGIPAGAGEFAVGLTIFVGNIIMDALKPISTSPQSAEIISTYTTGIALFTIACVIVNFLIGYITPIPFSAGFLTGDFLMIVLLGSALQSIAPSVVTGMVIALLAVLAGLTLKILTRKKGDQYPPYEY